jgi:hypothetical protein
VIPFINSLSKIYPTASNQIPIDTPLGGNFGSRIAISLMVCFNLCGAEPKTRPATVEAGPPEAGVIKGTAMTSDRRPIKTFGGSIYGYSAKSGQKVSANIEGEDGKYSTDVGPGQFATRAWTEVEYNGRKYRIDLDSADGKGGLTKQHTKRGVVKNFVWKLDGFREGVDARSTDRYYSHHGGSINLNPEGHGVEFWYGIKKERHEPELKIPADAKVELTLTPDGPLIDGSQGKPVVLKIRGADITGYMDRITRGIAIGRYKATATATLADGTIKRLRVTPYYTFKEKEAPAPSETAILEFMQSKPPSDNINGVDEINVHVMY